MQPLGSDFSQFPVGETQAGMAQLQRAISTRHGQISGGGVIGCRKASVSVLRIYDGEMRYKGCICLPFL